MAELVAVKGIGEWSAHIFLMFTLGRPDVLAVGDLGIRRAVQRAYGLDGPARGRRADRARRAVAPAPHGGLPAAVELAGQRPDVSVADPPAAPRRARGAGRRSSATPGRSSRRSGCPRSRSTIPGGRRARAVPGRRARMGGGRRRRPPRRLPDQRRRRRLRARRAGQRRARPRPPRPRRGAHRPPRGGGRRRGPPRGDADDLPRRAVERALLRAPGLHAWSRPPTRAPSCAALVAEEAERIPGDAPRVAMRRAVGRRPRSAACGAQLHHRGECE